MSSFNEKKLTCPYDKLHQLAPDRMQQHLAKCKRQHPDIILKICPFNVCHHIREEVFDEHIRTCPERRIIENHEVVRHPYEQGASRPPPPPRPAPASRAETTVGGCDEDWDAEMATKPIGGYDATANAMSKKVLRAPGKYLTTKSERKHFRQQEAERWAELDTNGTLAKTSEEQQGTISPVPVSNEPRRPLARPASALAATKTSSMMGATYLSHIAPLGISASPTPPSQGTALKVKSIGRGRGAGGGGSSVGSGLGSQVRSGPGGSGGGARSLTGGPPPSTTGCGSETATFETGDFHSIGDDSIVAGNLNVDVIAAGMRRL